MTFTLPDKAAGALYLNYDMAAKKGTAVTANAKYYANKTPNLASVTFVPAADYFGTVSIKYNAYMDNGSFYNELDFHLRPELPRRDRHSPNG